MQNEKIFCLLKKRVIKQAYKEAIEDLKYNVKLILNLYANRVDDFIDSSNNKKIEESVLFYINSEIYFCKKLEINRI